MEIFGKKILITGGAGFIGSHLAERLSRANSVVCLDNYSSGSYANHIDGVKYINSDTVKINNIDIIKPDLLFHLGEYSRVENSLTDVERVVQSNIIGTSQILEFWRKNRCKLIYAGSSTKFGDGGATVDETPYALTKAQSTELVNAYGRWYGLEYSIVYFYNVYGGREIATGNYSTVVAKFLHRYAHGLPLQVVRPGTQERNFTHIDDVVEALEIIAKQGQGDGYGIGCKERHSIFELAKLISDDIEFIPERPGNRMQAELKTNKTIKLGWSAKKSLVNYITAQKLSLKHVNN